MTATDPHEGAAQRRLRGVVDAGMHQLRTPLQAVVRFAEMLLDRDLDPVARRRALETVVRSAERAVRTVEDIEVAAATGTRPVRPDTVDIARVAQEVVRAVGIDADVTVDVPADLEAWCDPDHLAEILSNLFVHATGRHGLPPVSLEAEGTDGMVHIRVGGHSENLPSEVARLSERGARSTADTPGPGLALGVARELAEVNGGALGYEGGSVVLWLPTEPVVGHHSETSGRPEARHPPGSRRLFLGQFGGPGQEEAPGRVSAGAPTRASEPDRGRSVVASSRRPKIEEIELHRRGDAVAVRTELSMGGRHVDGQASSGPRLGSSMEAVAEATLRAVEQVLGGAMRLELDEVRCDRRPDGHVAVRVHAVGDGVEQTLVGVALIRDDHHRAALKATLGAVNRRMAEFLDLTSG